jgi:DNA repair photolyase
MQNILEACKKYRVAPMVSFSITGLGNTTIEPGVMKYNDLLDNIEKLVKVGVLDPRTTTVRVDPILPGVSSVDDLRKIIERAVAIGVRKFVTSPMQTYSTQKDRKGNSRSVIPHIDAALKADISSPIKYKEAVLPDGSYNWMKIYGLHPN